MRMIDVDKVDSARSSWKKSQKTLDTYTKYYIEMRPEAPGVWAKGLIPNFAIIILQTQERAGSSLPGGSWEGVKSMSSLTYEWTQW